MTEVDKTRFEGHKTLQQLQDDFNRQQQQRFDHQRFFIRREDKTAGQLSAGKTFTLNAATDHRHSRFEGHKTLQQLQDDFNRQQQQYCQ
jgi:hypothetical protein